MDKEDEVKGAEKRDDDGAAASAGGEDQKKRAEAESKKKALLLGGTLAITRPRHQHLNLLDIIFFFRRCEASADVSADARADGFHRSGAAPEDLQPPEARAWKRTADDDNAGSDGRRPATR